MAAYDLGGFASQLSPGLSEDDVLRAYQASGGAPDQLRAPPAPQPQQAPVVSRAPGSPSQAIRAYDDAALQGANERIALVGRQGADAAATHDAQGELYGQQADAARADSQAARARGAKAQERGDYYTAEADRVFSEMKAHSNPPGPKAIDRVMGVLGGVLAMGGNAGAAQGAQLIGHLLGSGVDKERWAAEQEHNTRLYQAATQGASAAHGSEAHAFDTASRMIAADAHYYSAALEKVKQSGLSKEAYSAATRLQMDLRDKSLEYQRALEVQKQKAASSAQGSARDAYFWRVPLDQLRAMPSEVLGKAGQKVLAERTKQDQSYRSGENAIGSQELDQASKVDALSKSGNAETAGQEVLPGLRATIPLERKDVSDIRANAQTLQKIEGNYARLAELRRKNKGTLISNADDQRESSNIISEMTGLMNQFAGRGAPSNAELEDMRANLLDPTSTYVRTDPEAVYGAQVARLKHNFASQLEAIGVRPAGAAPQPPASAPAAHATTATVPMINPATGGVIQVAADKLDAARAHGLVPAMQARGSMASRILGHR